MKIRKFWQNTDKETVNVNMRALDELRSGHLMFVRVICAKIYSALPKEYKEQVVLEDLQEAAMLHDYGKVLIPEKILNKETSLNDEEKKIMELHSELGYELLKQQGVKEGVLNLIKYHHQIPDGSGYPSMDKAFEYGIASQILHIADVYSALTEERSYKKALTKTEALEIIFEDVQKGIVSEIVFNALKQCV